MFSTGSVQEVPVGHQEQDEVTQNQVRGRRGGWCHRRCVQRGGGGVPAQETGVAGWY